MIRASIASMYSVGSGRLELRDGVAAGGGDVHFTGVYRGLSRTGSRMRAWNRMQILVELREGTRE